MDNSGLLLNFGDIFTYNGNEYVYLAASPENNIDYAARILSPDHSHKLNDLYERMQRKGVLTERKRQDRKVRLMARI
jgi:hypothetical protein